MGDIVRTRKTGTSAKPIPWTLLDGDGNVEDFVALGIPIGRFTVRFRDLPAGAGSLSAGSIAFNTDGSDGRVDFSPALAEIPGAKVDRQYEVHVDFDGAGAEEVYPTKDRYIVKWSDSI